MSNVKGKGQRLIPEELLKYLEAYKTAHPNPEAGGGATLDDIVDAEGNKRFVEGNGTPGSIEGLTATYCKWSLSGTHLMCVLSATLSADKALTSQTLATFTVPDYIGRKIFPIWGNHIEIKEPYIKTSGGSGSTMSVWIDYANNNITFKLLANVSSASAERYFRLQFDLLIDATYE